MIKIFELIKDTINSHKKTKELCEETERKIARSISLVDDYQNVKRFEPKKFEPKTFEPKMFEPKTIDILTFEDSIKLAEEAGVPEEEILHNKEEAYEYFMN